MARFGIGRVHRHVLVAVGAAVFMVEAHGMANFMNHVAHGATRTHVDPLLTTHPANVAGASVAELLDNLKLPEYRTRYRTRRELRGHEASEVLPQLKSWVAKLNIEDARYEHHLVEALWVTWGLDQVDESLLHQVLQSKDYHARAAAVRVLRYSGHKIKNQSELLMRAAQDEHGRVRLEALVAASWLDKEVGLPIVMEAGKKPLDRWMEDIYAAAVAHLNGM